MQSCLLPVASGDSATRSHSPPSAIISTILMKLLSFSKQAGNIQTAVIKTQRCTLELVLNQPGGFHRGEKHLRSLNPTTDWHLTLQGGKSSSLSYSTAGITGNQDSTSNHHKTLEQKLPILLQNQNQTDAFQFNKLCHRQKCAGVE